MTAANSGQTQVVQAILCLGGDPDLATPSGATAYHYATNENVCEILKNAGAKVPDTRNVDLIKAVQRNEVDRVIALLAAGADVNSRGTGDDLPPLAYAVGSQKRKIAEILIKAGADVNLAPGHLLYTALMGGNTGIAELLLNAGATFEWDRACWYATKDTMAILIADGLDVHGVNNQGKTCLMIAAGAGRLESVRALLNAGAEVNTKAPNGSTALIAAAAYHEKTDEAIQILLKAGANPNAATYERRTALHEAVCNGHAVEPLLKAGADVNSRMKTCNTPLIEAARCNNVDVVPILVDAGADLNAKGENCRTAIETSNRPRMQQLLLRMKDLVEQKTPAPPAGECTCQPPVGLSGSWIKPR